LEIADVAGRIISADDANSFIRVDDTADTHGLRVLPYHLREITHILQIFRLLLVVIVILALLVPACSKRIDYEKAISDFRLPGKLYPRFSFPDEHCQKYAVIVIIGSLTGLHKIYVVDVNIIVIITILSNVCVNFRDKDGRDAISILFRRQ